MLRRWLPLAQLLLRRLHGIHLRHVDELLGGGRVRISWEMWAGRALALITNEGRPAGEDGFLHRRHRASCLITHVHRMVHGLLRRDIDLRLRGVQLGLRKHCGTSLYLIEYIILVVHEHVCRLVLLLLLRLDDWLSRDNLRRIKALITKINRQHNDAKEVPAILHATGARPSCGEGCAERGHLPY